MHKLFI